MLCKQCWLTPRTKNLSRVKKGGGGGIMCSHADTHHMLSIYGFLQPSLHMHAITVACGHLPGNTNLIIIVINNNNAFQLMVS